MWLTVNVSSVDATGHDQTQGPLPRARDTASGQVVAVAGSVERGKYTAARKTKMDSAI